MSTNYILSGLDDILVSLRDAGTLVLHLFRKHPSETALGQLVDWCRMVENIALCVVDIGSLYLKCTPAEYKSAGDEASR